MKKLINVLVLIIFMSSFFLIFKEVQNKNSLEIKNIENKLENSYDILIPSNITELPRNEQYDLLADVSESALSSIFFTRIERENGKEKIVKYIYTMDNEYMDSINIRKGKKLDKTLMNSEFFLSTEDTKSSKQIGIIDNMDDDFILEIKTLQSMLKEELHFTGICTVNLPKDKPVDVYMGKIGELFGVEDISFTPAGHIGTEYNANYIYTILILLLLIFIIIYKYIALYKELGIKKLLGYSKYDIYKAEISVIIKSAIFNAIISIGLMSMILIDVYNKLYLKFLTKVIFIYLITIIIIVIAILVTIGMIYHMRVIDFIKNKKYNSNILFFNLMIKSVLILIIIGMISTNINLLKSSEVNFKNSFDKWNSFNDYVVLNIDDLNFDIAESEKFINGQEKLYKKFNKEGAIFAAFGNYSDVSLEQNKNVDYYKLSGIINPNYLEINPIYDDKDKKIEISENDEDWILLVPELYKQDQEKIYNYYNSWSKSFNNDLSGKVKIIWVKSNQKYFTYNINVNLKENNYLINPIVMVGTECGLYPGWSNAIFNVQGNPLKVKIESRDNLYEKFIPIVEAVDIDASSLRINFANEEVLAKINEYKTLFYTLTLTIIIALFLVIVIITQNTWNFFEQNKLEIAIKKLNGYRKISKYKECFKNIVINYVIIFILGMFINKSGHYLLMSLVIASYLIESIMTLIILEVNSRKKIIMSLKGEY